MPSLRLTLLVISAAIVGFAIMYSWTNSKTVHHSVWGDTGFVEGAQGLEMGRPLMSKLGIPALQAAAANEIFRDYVKKYTSLERRHTKHTTDSNGHVYITIEPFVEEMYVLATDLQKELSGIVDQRIAPPSPIKGQVHASLPIFRQAGEAQLIVELWKSQDGQYHWKQEAKWVNGGSTGFSSYGRDANIFPIEYRLYWNEGDASVTSSPNSVDSPAAEILRKTSEKYGTLKTLSAKGKIVTQVKPQNGPNTTIEHAFSINLARPEFYRIEWKQTIQGVDLKMTGAAWSAGEGHKVLLNGKVSNFLNREQAIAMSSGISGGATHSVPSLFFRNEGSGLHTVLTNTTLLPEETVGGDLCHVISGKGPSGSYTLWITQKDLLLKQTRRIHEMKPVAENTTTPEKVSSETMRKLAKTMGLDDSPEAMSKLTKQMDAMKQQASAMQITSTETFEVIVMNELMIEEDFEVKVPSEKSESPK